MSRTEDILNNPDLTDEEKVEQLRRVPSTVPRTSAEAVRKAEQDMAAAPPGNNRERDRAARDAITAKLDVLDRGTAPPSDEADEASPGGPTIEMVSRDKIRQETTDE